MIAIYPKNGFTIEGGTRYQKEKRKIRYDKKIAHRWVPKWEGTTPSNLSHMVSIKEVYDWLSSLKLLWLNIWARIYPTGQVWSTCSRVVAASWWSRGQYKYIAILRGRERRYGELTFLNLFIFKVVPATGEDSTGVGENPPTGAPQVSTVVQVPVNIFTGTLQGIIGFTNTQVQVLVNDGYESQ